MRQTNAAFFVAIYVLRICKKQQYGKLLVISGCNFRGDILRFTGIRPMIR
jgi:hypothetical protein